MGSKGYQTGALAAVREAATPGASVNIRVEEP